MFAAGVNVALYVAVALLGTVPVAPVPQAYVTVYVFGVHDVALGFVLLYPVTQAGHDGAVELLPDIICPVFAVTEYVFAGHAVPEYVTVFDFALAQPSMVLSGAVYLQSVEAARVDADEYVPPVTDTPVNALHADRSLLVAGE